VAYVLAKIVPLSELYTHIEWPVVVLLGSMIPLGAALETSGGTELIAGALIGWTEGLPAWAVLTVLMVVTMTLSDVLNNTATTIVAAPVGIQMAQTLGVSPDPFLMAVAVAASSAFLTPIGHKNNTLILGRQHIANAMCERPKGEAANKCFRLNSKHSGQSGRLT